MKRYMLMSCLVAGLIAVIGSGPVTRAEDKKVEERKPTTMSEISKEAQLVMAAFQMAEQGRKTKSPEMLLAAARVIGKTNFEKLTEKELADSNKAEGIEAKLEAGKLLDDAVKLAGDNAEVVKKMADIVKKDIELGYRGAVPGPKSYHNTVSNHDRVDGYSIVFRGGDPAHVKVRNTTNRGDIDLVIYDSAGRVVASDRRRDDDAEVLWYPNSTQSYRVVVKCYSSGGRTLHYHLITN